MKTVIKNILEHLSDKNIGVTIQMDNCKLCLNNRNARYDYVYFQTFLSDKYKSYKVPYVELIVDPGFIDAMALYIWNYAPRSKTKYPKIMWPEWQLKYKKIEEIKEDMKALFGSTIMDNSTEEYLKEFYEKNLLHNIK